MRIRIPLLLVAAFLSIRAEASGAQGAWISGRVFDSGGTAVAGARVISIPYRTPDQTLLDLSVGREPAVLAETKTDPDGAFRLTPPNDGSSVSIRILADGLPAIEMAGPFDEGGGGEDEIEVSIPAARRICGRITDESGKPVARARIRSQAPLEATEDAVGFDNGESAADGTFCLAASPDGEAGLHVRARGLTTSSTGANARSNQKIVLRRGGSVEGLVTDPAGKPVSGAIVTSGDSAVETDAAGRYRFEALAEGLATLQVLWREDLLARRDAVRIRSGAVSQADLRLSTSAGIAGAVLDGKTRRPLGRARVTLALSKFGDPGIPPVAKARTDSRGRFRLMGLVRREYQLSASRAGYLSTGMPVTASAPASGALRIALFPSAAITGRVIDEQGGAVRGARVQVDWSTGRRAMLFGDPSRPAPSAFTSEKGAFRLAGIAPETVVSILATREGFVPARRGGIVAGADGARPLTLTLRRGLQARGRVVDVAGDAISGAEVRLSRTQERRVGGGTMSGEAPESVRSASTDGEGRFALRALEAGKYAAEIRHPNYATRAIGSVDVKPSAVTEWPPFVLSPSAPVGGVVRNSKEGPVAGATISTSSAEGGYAECLTDSDGRFRQDGFGAGAALSLTIQADGYAMARQSVKAPAPELTIVLTTAGVIRGRAEDGETQQPITAGSVGWRVPRGYRAEKRDFRSDDGTFEVTGVTPGKVEVTASAPGYLDGKVTGVEVSEGEVKEGVVVSLKKGRAISGRVLDPERGGGVPNATVSWRRPSDRMGDSFAVGPNGAFAMFPNSATTDAEGRFEYDAVPPEKLIFKASHPDFLDAEVPLDASSESAVEITLSQGGSIKGIVRNRDGSSPVAGAEVTLQVSGATPMAISGDESQSDENGDFSFRHLKEGRYLLTARSSSGRSAKTDVVLNSGQNAEGVVLQMSSGTTLRGTVTGLPVERLAGLEIGAYSDTFSGRTSTDPTGAFIVSDVPPGVVVVSAATARWGAGTRSVSKNVDVPEGAAEVPVEIVFSGTSRLEVRVTRKDQPLAGIGLNVRPDPASTPGSQVLGETDADGRAVLEGLEDGAYILSGSSFGGGGGSFLRQITVSGDTSVDVALGRASISGTVTDASSGEPLADASVSAENGQEAYQYQMPSARTDSQGNYSLDNLDPGEFQVTARRDGYKQKTLAVTAGESPTQLSFKLSRGGGLTVVASDGLTGLPLSGLSALAFSDSGTVAFSGAVSLDAGGTGEIQSLGPGTYSLYVASAGYSVRSLSDVRVPSAPLALSLTPGGRLEARAGSPASGRIVDSNGQPYLLSLWSLDGRIAISPPLSAWDHMAPGSYNLVIDGPEGRKSFPFAMKEGETTRLELP